MQRLTTELHTSILANSYRPKARKLRDEPRQNSKVRIFTAYRDELLISTKAVYALMWDVLLRRLGAAVNTAGEPGSELKADGLDYVDIFYHHRMVTGDTPLEETWCALAGGSCKRKGARGARAVGLSNYNGENNLSVRQRS